MTEGQKAWAQACLALDLLAHDPAGLRGICIRARSGPVRDAYIEALGRLSQPLIRLHPALSRDALLGGLDLAATLAEGRLVSEPGLLDQPGTFVLAMAERCPPDMAALLATRMETRPDQLLVLLDEGVEDERAPAVLTERLAFHVALDGIGRLEATPSPPRISSFSPKSPKSVITNLTTLAARLGIGSLRPPQLAVTAARAHAALQGRDVTDADVQAAAELVLAPRATRLPEPDVPDAPPDAPQDNTQKQMGETLPEDILVEAVTAMLPSDLLENNNVRDISGGKGTGAGQKKKGNRRGRPLPARPGRLDGSARLDLVATLRTAAPWQKLRKRGDGPVRVFPSDVHVKRYEDKSDRLIIFAVDASGSAALARLAEAKGAVELLLSRAYAKRDHVSLIAFRGEEAELLLPPTRSLVQTKKRLAGLPGGGGTPLAAGLKAAGELAHQARSQGLSPMIALLTDGRANIALDGRANRAQAAEDSTAMARWLSAMGLPVVVLDLGNRPAAALATLAKDMNGTYLPLPRADATTMSTALNTAMQDGLGA